MRNILYIAVLVLAGCSADNQSHEVLSERIESATTSRLCSAYFLDRTTARGKLMIEAELATRGVNRCPAGNYGRHSLATIGSRTYDREISPDFAENASKYNCSDFSSSPAAQKLFLSTGGPVTDSYDLDRDGDGLACEWGTTIRGLSSYSPKQTTTPRSNTRATCFTGPRGGTYTITASGAKNYNGC